MRIPKGHYGDPEAVNRWARRAMALVVLIVIGVAVLTSALGDDDTGAGVFAAQADSSTSSSVTLAPFPDLVLGVTSSTPASGDLIDTAERTPSVTTTSLITTTTAPAPTTSTTAPTTTQVSTTTTLPPTTTTSSTSTTTTTLPPTTTTSTTTTTTTTTTVPKPDISIFLRELRGSQDSSDDGWEAAVRVTVDATENGVDLRNITVTGEWLGAYVAEVSGETNRQGRVTFRTPFLREGIGVAFRVTAISHSDYFYDAGLNQTEPIIIIERADLVFFG